MDPASLRELYDHHAWVMDRLLACALEIPPERAAEAPRPDALSLRDTLAHIVSAEGNWLASWQDRDYPSRFLPDRVTGVALRWRTCQADVRVFLAGLSAADLGRPFARYPRPRDRRTLGPAITHVLMHGFQHSAEAAELLTQLGHSPGQLDFMAFLDERERDFPVLPPS